MRTPEQKVGKCSKCGAKDRMVVRVKSVQLCSPCRVRYEDRLGGFA